MFLAWVLSFLILEFLLFDSWIRLLIIKCFKNSVLIQLPVFWKLCPRYQFISHKLLKIISTGWDCKSVLIEMLELSMLDSLNQFYNLPFKHFNVMKSVSGTVQATVKRFFVVHRMWTIVGPWFRPNSGLRTRFAQVCCRQLYRKIASTSFNQYHSQSRLFWIRNPNVPVPNDWKHFWNWFSPYRTDDRNRWEGSN